MTNHLLKPIRKFLSLVGARKENQRKERLILMMISTTRNLNISLKIQFQNIFLPKILQDCPLFTNQIGEELDKKQTIFLEKKYSFSERDIETSEAV